MRKIFISFFLSILLLKYASSEDSPCVAKESLVDNENCEGLDAKEGYKCIAKEKPQVGVDNKPCEEVMKCDGAVPAEINYENCKDLWTENSQKCVVDDDGEACKIAADCTDIKKGANAYVCGLFTTDNQKCVVADDGEACKVAADCTDIKKGANANVCDLFTTDNQKCVVAGDKCIPKTICGKEIYESGTTNCRESVTVNDNLVCVDKEVNVTLKLLVKK